MGVEVDIRLVWVALIRTSHFAGVCLATRLGGMVVCPGGFGSVECGLDTSYACRCRCVGSSWACSGNAVVHFT